MEHLKTKGPVHGAKHHSVPSLSPTQAQGQPEPEQQELLGNSASEIWTRQTTKKAAQSPSVGISSTLRSGACSPRLLHLLASSQVRVWPKGDLGSLSFSLSRFPFPLLLPLCLSLPPPLFPISPLPLPLFSLSSPLFFFPFLEITVIKSSF